jgi:hypothetical protein
MIGQAQIWTYRLDTSDLEITSDFGFTTISILAVDDSVIIAGNKTANGVISGQITLQSGQSITINSGNNETNIIDYLYIQATSLCDIVAR